ncbi:MAG: hypothetical protein WD355_02475 [Balneolaceae bacterium]
MTPKIKTRTTLQEVSRSVEGLNSLSKKILKNMDAQIRAVIQSDSEQVEQLSEEHIDLMTRFNNFEKSLKVELESILQTNDRAVPPYRLEHLKLVEPDEEETIDRWKNRLSQMVEALQKKQNHLTSLLKFALSENSRFMKSIYSLRNEKELNYARNGDTTGVSNGVAVNQEV